MKKLPARTVVFYLLWWLPTVLFHFLSAGVKSVAFQLDRFSWWLDAHYEVYAQPVEEYLDAHYGTHLRQE